MGLREVAGYLCLILAIAVAVGALWAARHFSRSRVYKRQLRRDRQARREVRAQEQAKLTQQRMVELGPEPRHFVPQGAERLGDGGKPLRHNRPEAAGQAMAVSNSRADKESDLTDRVLELS
jgi:hypothetical protein